jgi:transcriptional regulator EpsA
MNVQRIVRSVGQDALSCQSLKNPVLKILNSIDPRGLEMRPCVKWPIDMNTESIPEKSSPVGFSPTVEETARYLRIVSQSQTIRRHVDLFVWLRGELQHFMPHEIFVSAWGDFANWDLKLDVISALPGVRTEQLQRHPIEDFLKLIYSRWVEGGRRPLLLKSAEVLQSLGRGSNPLYASLREMQIMVVHGIRDQRGGHESLYAALNSGSFTKGRCKDRFLSAVDSLVPQIDVAFRRIAAYPLAGKTAQRRNLRGPVGVGEHELSAREQEILGWICQGKTNVEIAAALRISPFTVKNHAQRIFRKIGVTNRMQAATKYSQALSELREYLELSKDLG